MPDFKTYDPALITMSFAGILVQGFAEGTMISAERNENSFEETAGSQGDVTRVRTRNRTGLVTITLQAESPTNDLLSTLLALDESTGAGVGPLQITNLIGTTAVESTFAWIKKPPTVEYGNEAGTREWIIACADLEMFVGGSLI